MRDRYAGDHTLKRFSEIKRCTTRPVATRLQHIAAVADRARLQPLQRPVQGRCRARDLDQLTVQPACGATVTSMQAPAGRRRCEN